MQCSKIVKYIYIYICLITFPPTHFPFHAYLYWFSLIFFIFMVHSFSHAYASAYSLFFFFFFLPQPKPLFPSLNSCSQTNLHFTTPSDWTTITNTASSSSEWTYTETTLLSLMCSGDFVGLGLWVWVHGSLGLMGFAYRGRRGS